MSNPKAPAPSGGIIVRGGTTSSRHDRQRHEAREAQAAGERQVAKQRQAVAAGDAITGDGFVASRLHSLNMMDSGHPQLVLYYLKADGTVWQECISELFGTTDNDRGFTLVCPRCLERGEPQSLCQMKVMNKNRAFQLDPRGAGFVEVRVPDGATGWRMKHVKIAGTVTCNDTIKCDSCGLWRVTINDSKVRNA